METTFAMIKPNAVARGFMGDIISRFEKKGLTISAMKLINVTEEQAKKHYACHEGKPFYEGLLKSVMAGPVVVMAITGNEVIKIVRLMAGATNPLESQPGTIRGDFSCDMKLNCIHTSDSPESAEYELGIYFNEKDYVGNEKLTDTLIYNHF